jgi:peptidyl-prolyl cis-trans isomerase B (cyclophilin B)
MTQFKYLILALFFTVSCTSGSKQKPKQKNVQVELKTSAGNVILELSNETPLHRDNFVKLVTEGYFNGMLFHRVINNFGIQSGDPDSKNAQPGEALGNGGPGYTIPAEIKPDLFNKRGAILAARDNNPERASSGSQFFIVQGKVQTDSTLARSETRINQWLTENAFVNDPGNRAIHDSLQNAIQADNEEEVMKWADTIQLGAQSYTLAQEYSIPESHRQVYKTLGGVPHLDQNYTVFGEVIEGMNIVDSIAIQPVDSLDRPLNDIQITSATILGNEN